MMDHRLHGRHVAALVLLVLTFLLYSRTLTFDFVNWDDDVYVYENMRAMDFSLRSLAWFVVHPYFFSYTPLTMLSHAMDLAVWGLNPAGHHLTNVLLHVCNTLWAFVLSLMVFRKLQLRTATERANGTLLMLSLLAAALFAWHPLRAESVAWISDRKDLLCMFFLLPSIAAYLRFVDANTTRSRMRWYAATFVLFVLACLAKTIAVALPAVLIVFDVLLLKRRATSLLVEKLPFLLVSGILSFVALQVAPPLEQSDMFDLFTPLQRVLLPFANISFYLIRTLIPVGLSPMYPPHDEASSVLYTIVFVSISVLVVWLCARQSPLPLAAWLCYVLLLLPSSAAIGAVMQATADRYTYLPSLAVSIAAAGIVGAMLNTGGTLTRRIVVGAVAIAVVALAALTLQQQQVWMNSEALWTRATTLYPTMPLPHNNLGLALQARGELEGAKSEYLRAIALKPDYVEGHVNLGNVYFVQRNLREAERMFRRAAELAPHRAEVFNNLGMLAQAQGKTNDALQWLKKSVEADSTYAQAYVNLAELYARMGNTAAAAEAYRHAARLGYLVPQRSENESETTR